MEWGIGFIFLMVLFIAYVVIQETRAQMHWRGLVAEGDITAIRELVDEEAEHWRSARVPKGVHALLWHGIQTVELVDVTSTGARLSCSAEGEYSVVGGKRIETSSPLNEGMKITQKLAEMVLYDIPNVKLDHVQIDVYTAFRDDNGHAEPRCILSTMVERPVVEHLDWELTTPPEFVELTEGRFAHEEGGLITIEPLPWQDGATTPSDGHSESDSGDESHKE